jgi:hypothetical protein
VTHLKFVHGEHTVATVVRSGDDINAVVVWKILFVVCLLNLSVKESQLSLHLIRTLDLINEVTLKSVDMGVQLEWKYVSLCFFGKR